MLGLAEVRRWDAGALDAVFAALSASRDAAVELDHALAASRPPDTWRGGPAALARAEHARLAERLRRLVAGVAAVRPGIGDAADAVLGLQRGIADAEAVAQAYGFAVGPDGAVSDPHPPVLPAPEVERVRRERQAALDEVADRFARILHRAVAIDAALAEVLARVDQVDDGAGGEAATGSLPPPAPPPAATPAQSAAWWSTLSDGERAEVIARRPGWVTNRDGIPAAARHEANLARLPGEIARVDAEIAAAQRTAPHRLDELRARRDALTTLKAVGSRPHRQLLHVDTTGRHVTAAVAQGDVDTAAHVAVLTPGLGTTVQGSLVRYDGALDRLRAGSERVARQEGAGGGVATVAWLGYEAPQFAELADPARSVAGPGPAQRGAGQLAGFVGGVEASRTGDYHLTALGHSYGSLTTGLALRETTGVDDAILFGSPGIGTDDVSDLQVPGGHTWVAEAAGDLVADAAWFGPDPNQLDGVTVLGTGEAVDPRTGERLVANHGHRAIGDAPGAYLADDSTARYNFAGVVAGVDPARLVTGDHRDWRDHLNAPFTRASGN